MMIFIRLNVDMPKGGKFYPKGTILRLKTDRNKVPLDKFWRRRMQDTKTDNCLDILRKHPKDGFLNG